jgi:hypothetical protein
MNFWSFLRINVFSGIALVLGPTIFIGSLILHAYALHDMGLPIEAWVAIGLAIFAFGIIGILYQSQGQIGAALASHSPVLSRTNGVSPVATDKLLVPLEVFLETNDAPDIIYKRKLRIVLRNDSGKDITVLSAKWRRRTNDDVYQQPQDRHPWQIEEQLGGWEENKWKRGELTEISIPPGYAVWTYIGVHEQATHRGIGRRLVQGRLGVLVLVLRIDGQIVEQRISPGPIRT